MSVAKRLRPGALSLAQTQRWLLAVVAQPGGLDTGLARARPRRRAETIVRASAGLDAHARLEIYAQAYALRLLEVLEQDFAGLAELLGASRFEALARAYLGAHPPAHYSLNQLGRELPNFVRDGAGLGRRAPFLAELAALERALEEVFDAPRAAVLEHAELAELAPEAWNALRLRPLPSLRLFAWAYPTNAWYQAFKDGKHPAAPRRKASFLAVHRRDDNVWRLELTRDEHRLLTLLVAGRPLGAALKACVAQGSRERTLQRELAGWFERWSRARLFASLSRG